MTADARQLALHMDRHDEILILIDDHPLLAAWPRVSAWHRLERNLAAEFCERHECPAGNHG